ncbi:MAG: HD domain-containing protein [Firmicutes bacterium]|nr:HD domain-containing protein [Bacillota bacterium]
MSYHRIRDSIHGFIEVSDLEMKIIDSAPFQRLRYIKQLATTYLVYPGAEHTRFGHSLGVMHLVTKSFDTALENYKALHDEELFEDIRRKWYRQILRLIALTHDLGHAPFSHASEALFDDGKEHEDFTKKIICETEIASYILRIGKKFQKENKVGSEYDITPELLWLIYGEKNPELNQQYIMPDYKFLRGFMDGELDSDKMDYLLRDSHYCGVNYGMYDLNRLISSLNVYVNKNDNIIQLAIKRGGLHAFEEFVIARYFMFIQVYYQKTRRYLDKLLVDNIMNVLPDSKYPDDVNEFLNWDDLVIIEKIRENRNTTLIAKEFLERKTMECIYETPTHCDSGNDLLLFDVIKNMIKEEIGCDIFVDTPYKIVHKIPIIEEYDASSGKGIPIIVDYMDRPISASNESILLQSLIKPINIKRLYVNKAYAKEARNLSKKLLEREESDE